MAADWSSSAELASSLELLVDLDRGHGVRHGIETAIRQAIADGRLSIGSRLPSTRALARDLGVARGTVSDAYGQLTAEGYLRARQGAASQVVWAPPAGHSGDDSVPDRVPMWDLRPGRADSSSFPRQAWARAVRRIVQRLPDEALDYGDPRGTPELREALAAYLGRARGVRVRPGQLLICAGFTQALAITCAALRERGAAAVAMEDPNASRYRSVVRQAGLELVSVRCDADGLRVTELASQPAGLVVTTPAHQYPLGATLSPRRRGALIDWARATGALILEDDYDGEFRFDRRPVGALQQMDPDHVIYVGTASKILAAGLRLGWMTLPPAIADAAIAHKEWQDRGNGVIDQLVLADLISAGELDRHIRRMRAEYRRRRDALLGVLAGQTAGLTAEGVAAGMHALVSLPPGLPEEAVLAEAERHSLLLAGLSGYWHQPVPGHRPAIIVGYGTPLAHSFRPALDALGRALTAVTAGS